MKSVHDALVDAKAIQAERGLAKDTLQDPHGRVCIRGALCIALYGDAVLRDKEIWMVLECERAMGFTGRLVCFTGRLVYNLPADAPCWNNMPERTLQEVLDRFQQGIDATAPALDLVPALDPA